MKPTPIKVAVIPPNISVTKKLLFGNGIESITSLIKKITIITTLNDDYLCSFTTDLMDIIYFYILIDAGD